MKSKFKYSVKIKIPYQHKYYLPIVNGKQTEDYGRFNNRTEAERVGEKKTREAIDKLLEI